MNKFVKHSGTLTPLYRANIDTDQIIPKQFLKRIERTGYGEFLFYDWRFNSDGSPTPDFVMNDSRFAGSSILIAGANFGCGSSREHAPWSLMDYGFRAVIAPSFADIFYNNSLKNGLLPIVLPESDVAALAGRCEADPAYQIDIDLEKQEVTDHAGFTRPFEIDAFRKHCILNGLDDIGLTLQHTAKIDAYERNKAR
ncbi:MAG: 3-isopropylmalate dehydratase small subunit, partial [Acidobacteria bacterium]|nr:3-isopropylmalate dehydratase small subunit [Acidobacteriota bacterium]